MGVSSQKSTNCLRGQPRHRGRHSRSADQPESAGMLASIHCAFHHRNDHADANDAAHSDLKPAHIHVFAFLTRDVGRGAHTAADEHRTEHRADQADDQQHFHRIRELARQRSHAVVSQRFCNR